DTSTNGNDGVVVRASCPVLVGIIQDLSQIRANCTVVAQIQAADFYQRLSNAWSSNFGGNQPMPPTVVAVLNILQSQMRNANGTHFTAPDSPSDSQTYRELIMLFEPIFSQA